MRFSSVAALASFVAVANAHFQLQYPAPRGVFVEDNEPNFCDGYTDAVSNRTVFPLSGGFISLNSEHPSWTIGVEVSTASNPNTFDSFTTNGNQNFIVPFQQETGEGVFCIPVNVSALGLDGVKDGANVTIEIVFSGGDGQLYQACYCADLTLSANATIPDGSDHNCKNITVTSVSASSTATSPASSTSAGASSTSTKSDASRTASSGLLAVMLAAGAVLASL